MTETVHTHELQEGHPVWNYFQEKELIVSLLEEIVAVKPLKDLPKYTNIFHQLLTIEKRFARKENQLFPFLEKKGWVEPSQGMWSFQDNLREHFRLIQYYLKMNNPEKIKTNTPFLTEGIYRLMGVEEDVLFPNALEILTESDWIEMRKGEEEIGWMLAETPPPFPKVEYIHPSQDFTQRDLSFSLENTSHYDEGYMTVEQVNLLFKTIRLDEIIILAVNFAWSHSTSRARY